MPDQKSNFFEILQFLLRSTKLSDSFLDRISGHFEKLNPEQEKEAIQVFQENIQNGLVQVLNIGRPSFISNVQQVAGLKTVEHKELNSLAESYFEVLAEEKKPLFKKWLLHVHELSNRPIGKQRLDVFFSLFEKKKVGELVHEIEYRINIGHSGLFLNTATITEEIDSKSSNSRNDYFKKMAEKNERIGRDLAKGKPTKNDEKHNGRFF